MKYWTTILLTLIFNSFPATAQEESDTTCYAGRLYLNFRNINFIKNNEYSNPVIEGYTLIGYFLHPEIIYRPAGRVTLRLGTHLVGYSGTNKFSSIKPLFSTSYAFTGNSTLTLGSISGSDEHRMLDPHYNKERLYTLYSEDGVQFRFINGHFFNDTWLSWENFIFKGDTDREIFTAGESFRYSSSPLADIVRIEVPVQLQFKHYGGQISNYPQDVETYFNIASGARISLDLAGQRLGNAGVEYLVFTGRCLTENAPSGIKYGFGEWYRAFYTFKIADLEVGYWKSDDFFAPNGNFIFGSVSDHLENVIISHRRILTGSASITLLPESFIELYFGFDGYYDMKLKRFDNAVTLHLRFDKLFRLSKLKNN